MLSSAAACALAFVSAAVAVAAAAAAAAAASLAPAEPRVGESNAMSGAEGEVERITLNGLVGRSELGLADLRAQLATLTEGMTGLEMGTLAMELTQVADEDWSENWKQYYKSL